MHNPHTQTSNIDSHETPGAILHQAAQYDQHTRWLGLGVNGPASRMVVEMAQIRPGEAVLDVGCGTGNLTLTAKHAAGSSGTVSGLDASPEMIAEARKKARQSGMDAAFEVGLIEQMPYPDRAFDVVISRLVIHHLPGELKRRGFTEILRVLKPGGRFFAADFRPPTNPILAHLILVLVSHRMMQSRIEEVPPLLAEAGFVEVASGRTRSALLGFVRGKRPIS